MSLDSAQMFMHTKPYGCIGCRRTSSLVERPTSDGDGHLIYHERLGVARSGLMLDCHLVTGTPVWTPVSTMATAEGSNGPQGLCNDDDDDDDDEGSLAVKPWCVHTMQYLST